MTVQFKQLDEAESLGTVASNSCIRPAFVLYMSWSTVLKPLFLLDKAELERTVPLIECNGSAYRLERTVSVM
jgi:hypothetical protein